MFTHTYVIASVLTSLVLFSTPSTSAQPLNSENKAVVRVGNHNYVVDNSKASLSTTIVDLNTNTAEFVITKKTTNQADNTTSSLTAPSAITPAHFTGSSTVEVSNKLDGQIIKGFGGALTHSSAALINKSPHREEILDYLFTSSGANLNVIRIPIGASDFTENNQVFTHADDPQLKLQKFNINNDQTHLIPVIKSALQRNPDLIVNAAAWSAPGWMKNSGKVKGVCSGSNNYLKDNSYETYAQYLTMFVSAYKTQNINIAQLSLQNEPNHCTTQYPSMNASAKDQAKLAQLLHKQLVKTNNSHVKILGWDHNYYTSSMWGNQVASNPVETLKLANNTVDAIGYHCYNNGNDIEAARHGVKTVETWMSECSGHKNNSITDAQDLINNSHYMMLSPLRHGVSGITYWNIALDSSFGPQSGGCKTCEPLIFIDGSSWRKTIHLQVLEHFSRFVPAGSKVVASNFVKSKNIESVTVHTPDNKLIHIRLNANY